MVLKIAFLLLVLLFLKLNTATTIQEKTDIAREITRDPKLQQMQQIAKLHRLKTHNTESLEVFCLHNRESTTCPILAPHNTSTNIIAMFAEVKIVDKISDKYFSNLYALHFIHNKYIYRRIRTNIMPIYSLEWFAFVADHYELWTDVSNHMNNKSNAIIVIWNPLTTGIIGFGVYENTHSETFPLRIVYDNQTTSDNTNNQKIIGYIPQDHLQLITVNLSQDEQRDFSVLMLFLFNKNEIKDSGSIIGIRIPNHCRHTGFPVLSVYTKPLNNWTDFGNFQISNYEMRPICLLEPISYFSYEVSSNRYYKSFETIEYCTPTTLKMDSHKFDFDIVPIRTIVFPHPMCMDDELNIIHVKCSEGGLYFISKVHNLKRIPRLITNQTKTLCKTMAKCIFHDNFRSMIPLNTNTTYIDIYLYFWSMCHPSISLESAVKLLEKGMELLKVQAEHSLLFIHLAGLLLVFSQMFVNDYSGPIVERSTFAMQNILDNVQNGLILYQNKVVKSLSLGNRVNEFYIADSVEAIVQLSYNDPNYNINTEPITAFIIKDDYYYKSTDYTKTNLIAVYSHHAFYSSNRPTEIRVYLKVTNRYNDDGYWHTVYLNPFELLLIFITHSAKNVCDSSNKWRIISRHIFGGQYLFSSSNAPKTISVDIFSQLSMILNSSARRSYYQNYEILTIIKFITSSLSIFGILCMLMTCLIFKDWFKLRIYSNQLCISLLIQQIFFLLKTDLLNHIAYVIFYYSILTQFIWMAFVGYVQYFRFIKVFCHSQLNIPKSLILGWSIPTIITAASTIFYSDCLKCQFCAKNDEIFLYFVIVPIIIITVCNLVIYIFVMINLWTNDLQASYKKYRVRATIALPFMLGLIWIIMFTVMAPVPFISLVGWYLFYCIIPSQGFVLFIFMVLLDEDTRYKWLDLLSIKRKVN